MKKIYTLLFTIAIAITAQAQTNLIPNAGFETWTAGVPDAWFTTGATVLQSKTVKHGGESSISLTSPDTKNKTISPTTDIPVKQGVTYVFSGWYLDNSTTAKFKFWNQFRAPVPAGPSPTSDTGGNTLQAAADSVDSASWQFFTAEGVPNTASSSGNTTGLDATVARAGLRVYPETAGAGGGGGLIYFDDIMFYDKSTLKVDAKDFDNEIKMETIVSDVLRIKMPSRATVNIYSIDGKLYSSNRVNSNEAINTQSLSKGIYLVTIQNDFAKTSRKILKK